MNIGFDAKRAFLNPSGLGNYSRTLIRSLVPLYPENAYFLFTPETGTSDFDRFISAGKNISVVKPRSVLDKQLSSRWRSYGITRLLSENGIDIYHGLSNELPFNIRDFKGKKIVTIHDLIFLKHPKLYPYFDRKIYNKKFRWACENADAVIAVSEETKNDIIARYALPPEKIRVIYQSCDEVFHRKLTEQERKEVRIKHRIPSSYLLSVGTIEERKNLLTVVKALENIKDIPLVVVGKKKRHFKKVQDRISSGGLSNRVMFLENVLQADLPALYSGAAAFLYPSLSEGFGIPILEAITCGTPVITSEAACLREAAGPGSAYVNPLDHAEMSSVIGKVLASSDLRKKMTESGLAHSKKFLPQTAARRIMELYSEK